MPSSLSRSRHDALNTSGIGNRARPEPSSNNATDHHDHHHDSPNDKRAYDFTQFLLKMMKTDSPFFQNNAFEELPKFDSSEVSLDQNIGQGEFGVVFSIKSIRAPKDEPPIAIAEESSTHPDTTQGDSVIADEDGRLEQGSSNVGGGSNTPSIELYFDCSDISLEDVPSGLDPKGLELLMEPNVSKGYMSAHALRDGIPRYAVKRLRRDLKGNDVLVQATADLAAEANFLRSLRHPNICRMRGTIGEPGKKGFAIVLDRLTMTLREKMLEWKKLDGGPYSVFGKVKSAFWSQSKRDDQLNIQEKLHGEKQMAIYDIARALRHLAEHSVIYRDLKPENIGIDLRGDLRLFDFGLAKELKEKDMIANTPGMYKLTGMTGSRRYMAPEVILSKPYGLSADVYAFAILAWEVLSNRNAYSYLTLEKHFEMVVQRKKRPSLKKMVPNQQVLPPDSKLSPLIQKCWSPKPVERPSIQTVCETLFSEIQNASRKSRAAVDRSAHLLAGSIRSRLEETLQC